MIICSWDMVHDICNYFSFWVVFCPFTPLTAPKMKISKKWKKHLEISSFYTSVRKTMIICYTVPEIWHVSHVIVIFHFGLCFAPLAPPSPHPPSPPKNMKISEKWKKHLEMSSFNTCTPKMMIRWCATDGRTDGRIDRRKKWHTEVGAPPKNPNKKCSGLQNLDQT